MSHEVVFGLRLPLDHFLHLAAQVVHIPCLCQFALLNHFVFFLKLLLQLSNFTFEGGDDLLARQALARHGNYSLFDAVVILQVQQPSHILNGFIRSLIKLLDWRLGSLGRQNGVVLGSIHGFVNLVKPVFFHL